MKPRVKAYIAIASKNTINTINLLKSSGFSANAPADAEPRVPIAMATATPTALITIAADSKETAYPIEMLSGLGDAKTFGTLVSNTKSDVSIIEVITFFDIFHSSCYIQRVLYIDNVYKKFIVYINIYIS